MGAFMVATPGMARLAAPIYNLESATAHCSWPIRAPSNSQSREDAALFYTYFCRNPGFRGTFVEIGALDGEFLSNTKFFEHKLGWKGALIEGSPKNAHLLMRPHVRRNSTKLPLAVCPEGQKYVQIKSSGAVSADVELASDGFMEQWHKGDRVNNIVNVSCKPFGKMLRSAGLADGIDIASVDAEGAELRVLETMDWSIPVRVWMIELDDSDKTRDESIRALLKAKGYCQAPTDRKFLRQYCGDGPPAKPRPLNKKWCTKNEVFEQCSR